MTHITVFNRNRIVKRVLVKEMSEGYERHAAIGKISWTHYWLDRTRVKCGRNHKALTERV